MKARRIALGRRLLGFTFLPFLSSLAPFILLPLLARRVTSAEWAGLGLGQSVGMVGAVAITWGWQLVGPVLIAGVDAEERKTRYLDSILVRGVACLALTPPLALIAGEIAPEGGRLLSVSMAVTMCLSGLTPAWYFIGMGKPTGIAAWDILPRVGATVLAAGLIVWGLPAVLYPVSLSIAGLLAVLVFSVRELRGCSVGMQLKNLSRVKEEVRRGFGPMVTDLSLSLHSSGSVAFVGWRATTETVAVYSSAFRLYRLAVYFVVALANGLQSWVAEKKGSQRRRRMLSALLIHTIVGVVGMLAMAAFLPEVSTLLFGARLSPDHVASFYLGVAFLAASIGNSLGRHILIPEGATRGVFFATLAGAAVGIPLSVVFSVKWGTAGATAALGISAVVPCLLIARRAVRVLRRLSATPTPPAT